MSHGVQVGGLTPLTTIDYPGLLACVVFCQGCAWRCGYCHNPELLAARASRPGLGWDDVLAFLQQRQGLLDAVVFSGGEATLQPMLGEAMRQVRALGFKVGLHTAGIKPTALQRVLPLCDWVGFDIKGLPSQVDAVTGCSGAAQANWTSLDLLLASGVEFECRTTVHWQQTNGESLRQLAQHLRGLGVRHWVVQPVRSDRMLDPALGESIADEELAPLWAQLGCGFEAFQVR